VAYPSKLVETQNVKVIDAISGATFSHQQFSEAVERTNGECYTSDNAAGNPLQDARV
jgi:major membrane immunogen (membrane-anchored lipoprotein)